MLHLVPVVVLAGLHDGKLPRRPLGTLEVKHVALGPRGGGGSHDQEAPAARLVEVQPEELVVLGEEERVRRLGGPHGVPPHLVGAVLGVQRRVEDCLAVWPPHDLPRSLLQALAQQLPGRHVLEEDVVRLVPRVVDGEGHDGVLGGGLDHLNVAVLPALRELVHVQDDLLRPRRVPSYGALAAVYLVGEPFDGACVVEERAVRVGHVLVSLLDV
mmetsp:Transcript_35271/g.82587  ORF Transcript_35271/g.82587 Transcript_35271/m.82587 type:complete len:214 (-) Transcript_35271:415-1056(-)